MCYSFIKSKLIAVLNIISNHSIHNSFYTFIYIRMCKCNDSICVSLVNTIVPTDETSTDSSSSSTAAIIGGAAGGAVAVIVIILIIIFLICCVKRR